MVLDLSPFKFVVTSWTRKTQTRRRTRAPANAASVARRPSSPAVVTRRVVRYPHEQGRNPHEHLNIDPTSPDDYVYYLSTPGADSLAREALAALRASGMHLRWPMLGSEDTPTHRPVPQERSIGRYPHDGGPPVTPFSPRVTSIDAPDTFPLRGPVTKLPSKFKTIVMRRFDADVMHRIFTSGHPSQLGTFPPGSVPPSDHNDDPPEDPMDTSTSAVVPRKKGGCWATTKWRSIAR